MPALKIVEDNTPYELETIEHRREAVAKEVDKFFTEEQIATADELLMRVGHELTLAPKDGE